MPSRDDLRWFDALPPGFAPAKPLTVSLDEMRRWQERGKLRVQRKRDGHRHFLVRGTDRTRIYSRGLMDVTSTFPGTAGVLDGVLLPGTVLDTEFVVEDADGNDEFELAGSLCRSGPDSAARVRALLARKGLSTAFWVFDLLYVGGIAAWKFPQDDRWEVIQKLAPTWPDGVQPMPVLDMPVDAAAALVRTCRWEGLVGWRTDLASAVSLSGNPARVGLYRWKLVAEDDFVATGYDLGEGACAGVVGALKLAQYRDGRLVSCGKVGTGFDAAARVAALRWDYPAVVQIRYQRRTPNGHCRCPSFLRRRDDKRPDECLLPEGCNAT